MALQMKTNCQICDQSLEQDSEAYICVYECTFCAPCTEERHNVCPNCGGELVRRPKKNSKSKAISLCFFRHMKLYQRFSKYIEHKFNYINDFSIYRRFDKGYRLTDK